MHNPINTHTRTRVRLVQTCMAVIKEPVIRGVSNSSKLYFAESRRLEGGTELARLRRRFSFAFKKALSFRTLHLLCRKWVALTYRKEVICETWYLQVVTIGLGHTGGRGEPQTGSGSGGKAGLNSRTLLIFRLLESR